jgi:hypothetical protein
MVQGKQMRIALHDSDKTKFPNLALMKLSAWSRTKDNTVEWYEDLQAHLYDEILP